jgi:glycosyltransferase involved in cell wall biosynthesis
MSDNFQFIYVTEVDLSIDNGPGINEREIVKSLLNKFGAQIICVTPYPKHPNNYLNPKIEYVFPHQSSPIRYTIFLIALLFRILKLNRVYKFKALVFRLGIFPIVPLFLSLLYRKPLVLKTLAAFALFEIKRRKSWSQRILSILSMPIYTAVIKKAIAADTVSIAYIEWLNFTFGADRDKLTLIPNGANVDFFKPQDTHSCRIELGLEKFTKIIGYVGAFDSLRQIEDLIRCLRDIQDMGRVGLVLVGDGSDRKRLENLVSSLNLDEHVIFTGSIPYVRVPKYMNTFDVGIDLSLVPMRVNEKIYYASYSQKIPQYLSCGLPVITWDTADTRFLKDEQIGCITPVGDIRSLTHSIKRLLSMNKSEQTGMKLRARKYAESHLSTSKLAAKRMKLWQESFK